MTQPTPPQEEWHILIFKSKSGFGIGSFLDKILQMETGDTLFEIVPVKIPYSSIPPTTPPVIVPPPVPVPLWRGTAIGDGYSIRDAAGLAVGATKAGEPLAVYAENVTAGEYRNRVVITPPGVPSRNVWREGVRKA